jgi:hypothetical protein
MPFKVLNLKLKTVGGSNVVSVHPRNKTPSRYIQRIVQRCHYPLILIKLYPNNSGITDFVKDGVGAICRGIVNHNQFKVAISLLQNTIDSLLKKNGSIVNGQQNAQHGYVFLYFQWHDL